MHAMLYGSGRCAVGNFYLFGQRRDSINSAFLIIATPNKVAFFGIYAS